ncbi:MAG: hypothetical protein J6O41_05545 [Clostridia bacterium]|nr:hypothetical protein [Clostridia bacterium]
MINSPYYRMSFYNNYNNSNRFFNYNKDPSNYLSLYQNNYNNTNSEQSDFNKKQNIKEPILELFGIKFFLDDIIIIGLLFLLYNEGVNDTFLFLALILLLLT